MVTKIAIQCNMEEVNETVCISFLLHFYAKETQLYSKTAAAKKVKSALPHFQMHFFFAFSGFDQLKLYGKQQKQQKKNMLVGSNQPTNQTDL